jgi:hypothetical protein
VVAYPAETTEAFCDAHVRAFAFFGGVPKSILYDNYSATIWMRTAATIRVEVAAGSEAIISLSAKLRKGSFRSNVVTTPAV